MSVLLVVMDWKGTQGVFQVIHLNPEQDNMCTQNKWLNTLLGYCCKVIRCNTRNFFIYSRLKQYTSLHAPPVHVLVFSGYFGFLPQYKYMWIRSICQSILHTGVNGNSKCEWLPCDGLILVYRNCFKSKACLGNTGCKDGTQPGTWTGDQSMCISERGLAIKRHTELSACSHHTGTKTLTVSGPWVHCWGLHTSFVELCMSSLMLVQVFFGLTLSLSFPYVYNKCVYIVKPCKFQSDVRTMQRMGSKSTLTLTRIKQLLKMNGWMNYVCIGFIGFCIIIKKSKLP